MTFSVRFSYFRWPATCVRARGTCGSPLIHTPPNGTHHDSDCVAGADWMGLIVKCERNRTDRQCCLASAVIGGGFRRPWDPSTSEILPLVRVLNLRTRPNVLWTRPHDEAAKAQALGCQSRSCRSVQRRRGWVPSRYFQLLFISTCV